VPPLIKFLLMKKKMLKTALSWGLCVLLLLPINSISFAATINDSLSAMAQIPVQQFVTSEATVAAPEPYVAPVPYVPNITPINYFTPPIAATPPAAVVIPANPSNQTVTGQMVTGPASSAEASPSVISGAIIASPPNAAASTVASPPLPPAAAVPPEVLPPVVVRAPSTGFIPPASAETAAALNTLERQAVPMPAVAPAAYNVPYTTQPQQQLQNPVLIGGIEQSNFIRCARLGTSVCTQASDDQQFQYCLSRLQNQPACQKFLSFARTIGYGSRDNVDLVQHFPQANMDLIHVVHIGANYPGEYFALSYNGNLVNITSGEQTQAINISKDVRYQEIVQSYPHVGIWPALVGTPPTVEPTPEGNGLRLIFRYPLLNGCHACEKAGYANVAYDFSQEGELTGVYLISLVSAS
jgi:hypothetical protein